MQEACVTVQHIIIIQLYCSIWGDKFFDDPFHIDWAWLVTCGFTSSKKLSDRGKKRRSKLSGGNR